MPLPTGTRLNHYEVLGLLGVGGMGEVYRAADTKLKREVAIKVLPREFERDPARLARFEREAHVLASLNHPHIAAIYGLEHVDGIRFLALELVEGPTLADRLNSGPIEINEAVRIATEMAEALEAAHEKGVTHRDLKPANVKLTATGSVKVLDFGLAAVAQDSGGAQADASNSPTLTMEATRAGMIMGTAAYMSPEQARGEPVDKRADIWSFGVVFYEMVTGKRLFGGKTVSDILAAVLMKEPDWPRVPARAHKLLRRCLERDPKQRLRDIGEARFLLAEEPSVAPQVAKSRPLLWPTVAAASVLAVVLLAFLYFRQKPAPAAEAVRFEITQPEKVAFSSLLSVSPDGRKLAFVATGADGTPRLWIRSLETLEARPLEGTEGVLGLPFWSPDSHFVVFWTTPPGKLKKIEAAGGPAQTLCEVPTRVVGGFWTRDGKIVFGAGSRGLQEVAAAGGAAIPITTVDFSRQENAHDTPSLLPDERHFVYLRNSNQPGSGGIYLGSLDAKPQEQSAKRLLADNSLVAYAPSPDPGLGYILFVRGLQSTLTSTSTSSNGTLMAQLFDTKRLDLAGEPVPVAEQVPATGFSASATGVLVYGAGPASIPTTAGIAQTEGQLTWFDRQGKVLGTAGDPGVYSTLQLSPDGTKVAFDRSDAQTRNRDLWLFESSRGVTTRFTFDPAEEISPVWSPDGSHVAFAASRGGQFGIYQKASNLLGEEELLFKPDVNVRQNPTSWSHDGQFLLFYDTTPNNKDSVLALPLSGDRKPIVLVHSDFNERGARFSPDGKWFSYTSNESGKDEAYVRPFAATSGSSAGGAKWMVSKGGGISPHWRGDGKEIFYLTLEGDMMSVEVSTSPVFQAGVPKVLFRGPPVRFWDVTSDGKKFLLPVAGGANSSPPYKVVLNWTSTLKR